MKKTKLIISVLLLFCAAVWVFFPWGAVQSYVTARAFRIAANNGIFVSVKDLSADGVFDTEFRYDGVQADFPLIHFKTDCLTVNPKILSALLGRRAMSVTLAKGCLELVTKQQLPWNSGELELSAGKDTIFVRDISITGDFSARGFIEISRANGRISRAQLTMHVPDNAENAFEFLSKGALAGLSKDATGNWRLVR